MTFSDFMSAVRSAWGWFNNAGILLAVLAGVGINAVCAEIPTWLAVVLCVVAYVAGFLAACYRASAEASGRQDHEPPEGQASRIAELEAGLSAQDRADAELAGLRETFLHKIDPEQQAAVVGAWLSPGRRLDVSARPVRGLGGGFSLDELLVPDGDG